MRITCGTIKDLDSIAGLEAICFPAAEAASPEAFRGRLLVYPRHFWLLRSESGRLLSCVNGMATGQKDLTDNLFADPALHDPAGAWQMIFGVTTLPEYRHQGLAGRLLRQAIMDAKLQGRRGLVLTCKAEKLNWYGSFGFRNEGLSVSGHGGAEWYQMRIIF